MGSKDIFGFENPKPVRCNCIIAVTPDCDGYLIAFELESESKETVPDDYFLENVFDVYALDDLLTSNEHRPDAAGIYRCKIEVNHFKCSAYCDPPEWDMTVVICEPCEIINTQP